MLFRIYIVNHGNVCAYSVKSVQLFDDSPATAISIFPTVATKAH